MSAALDISAFNLCECLYGCAQLFCSISNGLCTMPVSQRLMTHCCDFDGRSLVSIKQSDFLWKDTLFFLPMKYFILIPRRVADKKEMRREHAILRVSGNIWRIAEVGNSCIWMTFSFTHNFYITLCFKLATLFNQLINRLTASYAQVLSS